MSIDGVEIEEYSVDSVAVSVDIEGLQYTALYGIDVTQIKDPSLRSLMVELKFKMEEVLEYLGRHRALEEVEL